VDPDIIEYGEDYCEHVFAMSRHPYNINDIIDVRKEDIGTDALLVCVKCKQTFDFLASTEVVDETIDTGTH
jgi:hypothetical protein